MIILQAMSWDGGSMQNIKHKKKVCWHNGRQVYLEEWVKSTGKDSVTFFSPDMIEHYDHANETVFFL